MFSLAGRPGTSARVLANAALTALLALVLGVGLAVQTGRPAAAAVSAVIDRGSAGVTADALPTAQVNGVVWDLVVAGNTVYAGGQFSTARPAGAAPGSGTVRRSNLLAFDIRTGRLTSFAPAVNGAVRTLALSPDKKTLYVGGSFTSVNGKKRLRFAALAAGSGALKSPAPAFNNSVRAIVATASTVYAGGNFSAIGKTSRSRLAAVSATTGKVSSSWKPAANGDVLALVFAPGGASIVAGGSFSKIGSKAACGMTRLNRSTAAVQSWSINTVVKNCGKNTAIMSLATDGSRVYGSGYSYGGGNYEGVFAATATGGLSWLQDCRGDTYDVAVANGRVYSAGHAHNCANIGGFPEAASRTNYRALAVTAGATGTVGTSSGGYTAFKGRPSPSLVNWFPQLTPGTVTGQTQAAWSVLASGPYVVLGGEFTAVNGIKQQGLVRMTTRAAAPRKEGPLDVATGAKPTVVAKADGSAVLSWKTVWDRDDQSLTYAVVRDGVVVSRKTVVSRFWNRTAVTYTESGLTPGTKYRWQIQVSDPDGNTVTSSPTTVTVPEPEPTSTPTPSPTPTPTPAPEID